MGFDYSQKVMQNFLNPKNMGEVENANGIAEVGNAACGDIMRMEIKVENNIIKDIKFKTFGCAAAIASTSVITQIVKEKPIEYAEKLTMKEVAEELKGLPQIKMHCSTMGIQTLRKAIKDYKIKEGLIDKPENYNNMDSEDDHKDHH